MRAMTVVPGEKGTAGVEDTMVLHTDLDRLAAMITRRVPLTCRAEALDRRPDDNVVVDLTA